MLTSEDIAYFAGVLDSQARIRVTATGSSKALLPWIAVSSPSTVLTDALSEASGVRAFIRDRESNAHRCAEHCTSKHDHRRSLRSVWQVSGARATIILSASLPYLRMQVQEAREAVAAGLTAQHWGETPSKMAALGWPVPEGWQ